MRIGNLVKYKVIAELDSVSKHSGKNYFFILKNEELSQI
jgi:hypothetical protein